MTGRGGNSSSGSAEGRFYGVDQQAPRVALGRTLSHAYKPAAGGPPHLTPEARHFFGLDPDPPHGVAGFRSK